MKITITPTQYEILDHRLTLPDCICEVFNATESLPNCEQEQVDDSVHKIEEMAKKGFLDFSELTEFDRLVLEDVMDGSTYLYQAEEAVDKWGWFEDALTERQYQGLLRSAENLTDKIEKAWKRIIIPS